MPCANLWLFDMVQTEYRIVVISDSPPNPSSMHEVESALVDAAKDEILTTFVNIDGPEFDGKFYQMMGSCNWLARSNKAHSVGIKV